MAQVTLPYTLTPGQPENVTQLTDNLNALVAGVNSINATQIASSVGNFAAWTSYTPTLTNATNGNGTLTGAYCQIGKVVFFRAAWNLGSTSSVSGSIHLSLPVTAANPAWSVYWGAFVDYGNLTYPAYVEPVGTTKAAALAQNASGSYLYYAATSATVPFTWGNLDSVALGGVYEAA